MENTTFLYDYEAAYEEGREDDAEIEMRRLGYTVLVVEPGEEVGYVFVKLDRVPTAIYPFLHKTDHFIL